MDSRRIKELGAAAMTRIVRFGDRVLCKPLKALKIDKTEARWKYGLWLGLFERAREHNIGTENDVIKCKAISPLSRDHKFDNDMNFSMKGTRWTSSKQSGHKVNTKLEAMRDENDEELDDEFQVQVLVDWHRRCGRGETNRQ